MREVSSHLEPIERLVMDVIRNPASSPEERATAIALLLQLAPKLPAHEARITALLLLIRDLIHVPEHVSALIRVLRALEIDEASLLRAILRLAQRAWAMGAKETLSWLIESGVIPASQIDPAWLPLRKAPALGARVALAFCGLSREAASAIERALSPMSTYVARAEDLDSLTPAARADIAFLLADMRTAEGRGLSRAAVRVLRERGALVIGIALHTAGERPEPMTPGGQRGCLGHAFFTIEASDDASLDAARLAEVVQAVLEPMTESSSVSIGPTQLRTSFREGGRSAFGAASATGFARASIAAERAIESEGLRRRRLQKGSNVLFRIVASSRVDIGEVDEIAACIRERLGEPASMIWTAKRDGLGDDALRVEILATQTDIL